MCTGSAEQVVAGASESPWCPFATAEEKEFLRDIQKLISKPNTGFIGRSSLRHARRPVKQATCDLFRGGTLVMPGAVEIPVMKSGGNSGGARNNGRPGGAERSGMGAGNQRQWQAQRPPVQQAGHQQSIRRQQARAQTRSSSAFSHQAETPDSMGIRTLNRTAERNAGRHGEIVNVF